MELEYIIIVGFGGRAFTCVEPDGSQAKFASHIEATVFAKGLPAELGAIVVRTS